MRKILMCLLLYRGFAVAQNMDSTLVVPVDSARMEQSATVHRFRCKQLIAPAALIGVGTAGVYSSWLKSRNHDVRDDLQRHAHSNLPADDYMQFLPTAAVYGLNWCGVKGRHDFRDRTVILATSCVLMSAMVYSLKYVTHVERPDGSSKNSFPSGHTAIAFMGAEFLRREYADVSPWIGVSGYVVAAGTGFLRLYNDRHWLTDVVAGAGFGILSTEMAYWVYPYLRKWIFKDSCCDRFVMVPFTTTRGAGVSCALTL